MFLDSTTGTKCFNKEKMASREEADRNSIVLTGFGNICNQFENVNNEGTFKLVQSTFKRNNYNTMIIILWNTI